MEGVLSKGFLSGNGLCQEGVMYGGGGFVRGGFCPEGVLSVHRFPEGEGERERILTLPDSVVSFCVNFPLSGRSLVSLLVLRLPTEWRSSDRRELDPFRNRLQCKMLRL